MAKNTNWNKIRAEYVATNISQRALADKYGVSYRAVRNRAVKEKWVEKRALKGPETASKAIEKAVELESDRLARLIVATNSAVDVSLAALEDKEQFNRYIVTEGIGPGMSETVEKTFNKIDTRALKDLTSVIKELTGLMRDFYNIPTPAQAEAQRINAERLALEQKKASQGDTDNTIKVVLSQELEDLAK